VRKIIGLKIFIYVLREEKIELLQKLEVNCRATDEANKGKLTPEDFYKVVKIQV
jgi:hypothetical protein